MLSELTFAFLIWNCVQKLKNFLIADSRFSRSLVNELLSTVTIKTSLLVREVYGSILEAVKSDTLSPTACHRCDDSVLPKR